MLLPKIVREKNGIWFLHSALAIFSFLMNKLLNKEQSNEPFHKNQIQFHIPGAPEVGVGIIGSTWAGPWTWPSANFYFDLKRKLTAFICHMLHSSCLVLSCLVYRATQSPVNALRWLHSSTWKKHRSQSDLKNGFKKVPREYDINFAPKIGKCFKNCWFFAQKWA